jgi:hypothetical protein
MLVFLVTMASNRQDEPPSATPEEQLQEVYSATYVEDGCLQDTVYDRKGTYEPRTGDFVIDTSDIGERTLRFMAVETSEPEGFTMDPDAKTAAILAEHDC